MRMLFIIGAILLILGLASLFVPVPVREKHGIEAGNLSIGVETVRREKVHPAISGILIVSGAVLMIASRPRRKRS